MKRLGWLGPAALLLVTASGCKVNGPSLGDDGPGRGCTPPKLTVVGQRGHGPLVAHPGQTLRVHGTHYTDDCHVAEADQASTIPKLQLVLQSTYHVGPVATVHPHGPSSAFTVAIRIPTATTAGPAKIFAAGNAGSVRLVVRP